MNTRLRPAAIFDLDGTLIRGSSERSLVGALLRAGVLSGRDAFRWFAAGVRALPAGLDMAFRGNRTYLRGKSEDEVQRVAAEVAAKWLVPAISPAALAEVEANRVAGRCIVLLTGTLALLARPVAQAIGAELVHATGLEVKAAAFTGRATNLHAVGPAKLRVAENLAARHALDLTDSAAYADRISDAHLLDSVRHPVAVNPDARLGRHARNRGWRIVRWH